MCQDRALRRSACVPLINFAHVLVADVFLRTDSSSLAAACTSSRLLVRPFAAYGALAVSPRLAVFELLEPHGPVLHRTGYVL